MFRLFRPSRHFIWFEWVVTTSCNLNCYYCVNQRFVGKKPEEETGYPLAPGAGLEAEIAARIVEVSKLYRRVKVNLTGGEPLVAKNIAKALEILTSVRNVDINLITNLILAEKVTEYIPLLSSILISLHIKYRNDEEVAKIVHFVNRYRDRGKVRIGLSQVDYDLTEEDREKLAFIASRTGINIGFQVFIPPWVAEKKFSEEEIEKASASFVNTLGKRCALGAMFYRLDPQGTFAYGLWCNKKLRRFGNFLAPFSEIKDIFMFDEFGKCPSPYCRCNYNTFEYKAYVKTCKKLKYGKDEMMPPLNFTDVAMSQSNASWEKIKLLSTRSRLIKDMLLRKKD